MNNRGFLSIFLRYGIIILLSIPNLFLFYFIFGPLTLYPVYWLLSIFFQTSLQGSTILVKNIPIELIDACIAGSAYYLLFALNLATPKIKKRFKALIFSFVAFLIINILRIFILSMIYLSGSSWFDFTHKLFWYTVSILFVILIWFAEVKLFKIKEIPFYSDLKFFYKKSSLKT